MVRQFTGAQMKALIPSILSRNHKSDNPLQKSITLVKNRARVRARTRARVRTIVRANFLPPLGLLFFFAVASRDSFNMPTALARSPL